MHDESVVVVDHPEPNTFLNQGSTTKRDAKKTAVRSDTPPAGSSRKSRLRFWEEIEGSPQTGLRHRCAPRLRTAPPGNVFGFVFGCFWRCGLGKPSRTNRPAQLGHVAVDTPFIGEPSWAARIAFCFAPDRYKLFGISPFMMNPF